MASTFMGVAALGCVVSLAEGVCAPALAVLPMLTPAANIPQRVTIHTLRAKLGKEILQKGVTMSVQGCKNVCRLQGERAHLG